MKKLVSIGIIILLLSISPIPSIVADEPTFDRTIYVDDDNTEGPWDGTQEHPYQHIQDAIDNASDGDTIYVHNGTYYEIIEINKEINLIGEDNNATIIKNNLEGPLVSITASDVKISNFKINNSYSFDSIGIGVYSNRNIVSNNIIYRGGRYAIRIEGANYNIITNNTLYWRACTGVGIGFNNAYDNIVSNNNISGFFACIKVQSCDNGRSNTIINNIISGKSKHGSRYGIFLWDSCKNFEITGNIFSDFNESKGAAIGIDSGFHNIHHNIMRHNIVGIDIDYFLSSFDDECRVSAYIHHNNFISNTQDIKYIIKAASVVRNRFYKNYWNETRIIPKAIIGRLHLQFFSTIPWLEFDWFPAREPYDIP